MRHIVSIHFSCDPETSSGQRGSKSRAARQEPLLAIAAYLINFSVNSSIIFAKLSKSIVFSNISLATFLFTVFYLCMKIQGFIPYNTTSNSPLFAGRVNLDGIDSNLIEIRKNDFISGVYYNDIFTQNSNAYKKERIEQYLNDIRFTDPQAKLFDEHGDDAPCKLAAIEKYLDSTNKSTLIINKFPKLFCGLPLNKIVKSLDTLSYEIRDNYLKYKSDDNYFNIDDKKINLQYVGKGSNSIVLKLFDDSGNKAAVKVYIKPEEVNAYSIFGELAVYHDLMDTKINNIPEFYFANPLIRQVEDKNKPPQDLFNDPSCFMYDVCDDITAFKDYDGYKGGWSVIEYIDASSTPKAGGIPLQEWLKRNHLVHMDLTADNVKNGFITDLGGIGELNRLA